jgi:hypothetical protein
MSSPGCSRSSHRDVLTNGARPSTQRNDAPPSPPSCKKTLRSGARRSRPSGTQSGGLTSFPAISQAPSTAPATPAQAPATSAKTRPVPGANASSRQPDHTRQTSSGVPHAPNKPNAKHWTTRPARLASVTKCTLAAKSATGSTLTGDGHGRRSRASDSKDSGTKPVQITSAWASREFVLGWRALCFELLKDAANGERRY